jgi:hypothetical protein
VDLALSSGD